MPAINEVVNLVNDTRSSTVGGIEVATEVFEMAIVPYLLNSASIWIGITKTHIDILDKIQNKFLQRILKVKTAIIPLMYWDLGQLLMVNRILKMKLLMAHHLTTLEPKSLANKIWRKEMVSNIDGLYSEVKDALNSFNLTMNDMKESSKTEWKLLIRKKIEWKNEEDLKIMLKRYKKVDVDSITKEKYGKKEYMNTLSYDQAVMYFKLRAKVCNTIKTHFKNNKEFEEDIYSCWDCSSSILDTSSHLKNCFHYEECKESLDLERTDHLVTFFQRVIKKREDEEESE